MKKYFWAAILLIVALVCQAQEKDSSRFELLKIKIPKTELKFQLSNQFWDIATLKNQAADKDEFRNDFFLRRARLGVQGTTFEKIDFTVGVAYDGVGKPDVYELFGRDNLSATNSSIFVLWDAFMTYKMASYFNLTFGYFRPQVGRENITSAFYCIGFEKTLPNQQLRNHMIGRQNGRETGLNIGGNIAEKKFLSLNYNLGFFNATSKEIVGDNSMYSPLLTGRMALSIGDSEQDSYKIRYVQTYYGTRKGVTLGYNQSYQGETELFVKNTVHGVDLLLNYGPLDLVAEYDWLDRDTLNGSETVSTSKQLSSIKGAYYFVVCKNRLLQPCYSYTESMNGKLVKFQSAGMNLMIYEDDLKFGLHYLWGKDDGDEYQCLAAGLQMMF